MNAEMPVKPTPALGLTSEEAAARLKEVGPNELPRPPRRGVVRMLLGVLSEPMFLLVVLSAGIYLAVGDLGEGLLIVGFAGLTILLVVVQEKRSENALEALRALATPSARVLLDGREQRISARDVGNAAYCASQKAAKGKYDLVLMGSQGRSALKNILLGSVIARVLSECTVPVLVVH